MIRSKASRISTLPKPSAVRDLRVLTPLRSHRFSLPRHPALLSVLALPCRTLIDMECGMGPCSSTCAVLPCYSWEGSVRHNLSRGACAGMRLLGGGGPGPSAGHAGKLSSARASREDMGLLPVVFCVRGHAALTRASHQWGLLLCQHWEHHPHLCKLQPCTVRYRKF